MQDERIICFGIGILGRLLYMFISNEQMVQHNHLPMFHGLGNNYDQLELKLCRVNVIITK